MDKHMDGVVQAKASLGDYIAALVEVLVFKGVITTQEFDAALAKSIARKDA